MAKTKDFDLVSVVTQMAEKVCENYNAEVVDVEWKKEGGQYVLRVFIDRLDEPVDLDLCSDVTRGLNEPLEEIETLISEPYTLEVSSPGIERPLKKDKDFIRFQGETIKLKLFTQINGKKEYIGKLVSRDENELKIIEKTSGKEMAFPVDKVTKVNIYFEF